MTWDYKNPTPLKKEDGRYEGEFLQKQFVELRISRLENTIG